MAGVITAESAAHTDVFEQSAKTPAFGSEFSLSEHDIPERVLNHPLLSQEAWITLRDSGRTPLDCTDMVTTLQSRVEFLLGAWLIDKIVPPGLGGSLLNNLQPQMLKAADVLNAGRRRNAILEPRRSAKTTSLWCVLLGRCYIRPVHMAGFTMLTTAKKTTERFRLDLVSPIELQWPDPKTRPVKLINSNGFERVEFPNKSVLAILSPEGDAIRSGAYDTLVLDEAGEAEPDRWAVVVGAVLPAFDTRGPHAQLIEAGTGGKYRDGSHFWLTLHNEKAGRLRYGVADDADPTTFARWSEGAGPIIARIHPGLDGLTTVDLIEENFDDLVKLGGAEGFGYEYLGYFGNEGRANGIIPAQQWKDTLQPGKIPQGVTPKALVFAVHPFGTSASIGITFDVEPEDLAAAAWDLDGNNPDGTRRKIGFKLLHNQKGVAGIAERVYELARTYDIPISYDESPKQNKAIADRLIKEARPRPKLNPQNPATIGMGWAQLLNGLEQGYVQHWAQEPLDNAAKYAVKKNVTGGLVGAFPNDEPLTDITPLECFAGAVQATPLAKPRARIKPIVVD